MSRTVFEDIPVSVHELEVGMHVVDLDRPWAETSFLLQGFVIKSTREIQELQRQCQTVFIQVRVEESEQFKDRLGHKRKSTVDKTATGPSLSAMTGPASPRKVKYLNTVGFEEAVEASRMTFDSARTLAVSIMDGLRIGRSIDMHQCREVVEDVVAKVLDNKDALRFLTMIKDKDQYTAEHSMNVCILCATFARHLGLMESEIKALALCGLLHDVGKSKVPLEILTKPDRLTGQEAYIMAEHTTYGRNILMSAPGNHRYAVDVAHSHHERLDGKGYPRGLGHGQIPYYAKIVSIVDAYDAMTSNRCYGIPKTPDTALKILKRNRGTQFDIELVNEFITCVGLYPPGCLVELEAGQLAIVVRANPDNPERPRVLVVTDAKRRPLTTEAVIDLAIPTNQSVILKQEVPNGTGGIDVGTYLKKGLKLDNS